MFSGPNTTLQIFGNPPHGFSHVQDLVNTDATPWLPSSTKYVRCPRSLLSMLCGVPTPFVTLVHKLCTVYPPPSIRFFCAVSPLMQFLSTLALSWILSKIEKLASSSFQDKTQLNLYSQVWHSHLSLYRKILKDNEIK